MKNRLWVYVAQGTDGEVAMDGEHEFDTVVEP